MKTIKDILETIAMVILFYIAAIIAFTVFCIFYYWYGLIFEPWFYNVCSPWIIEQIKVIFRHPENFCFALGLVVILAGSACMLYIAITEWWEKRKRK